MNLLDPLSFCLYIYNILCMIRCFSENWRDLTNTFRMRVCLCVIGTTVIRLGRLSCGPFQDQLMVGLFLNGGHDLAEGDIPIPQLLLLFALLLLPSWHTSMQSGSCIISLIMSFSIVYRGNIGQILELPYSDCERRKNCLLVQFL